ncbi:MAG: hypothetical protein J0L97_02870 [Alphaproteobacteria bacterium]|nr:hypothetical protein [Alphaproteobacteria bacterium]
MDIKAWATKPIRIAVLDNTEPGSFPDHEMLVNLISMRYKKFAESHNLHAEWKAEDNVVPFELSASGWERHGQMLGPQFQNFLDVEVAQADIVLVRVDMYGSVESSYARMMLDIMGLNIKDEQGESFDLHAQENIWARHLLNMVRERNHHGALILVVDPHNKNLGTSEAIPHTFHEKAAQFRVAVFETGNTYAEPTPETGPDHPGYLGYIDKEMGAIHLQKRIARSGKTPGGDGEISKPDDTPPML